MSAIDELNAFLRKSPSCIEPWEIRQYLSAIEAENVKMRELIANVHESLKADKAGMFHNLTLLAMEDDMRELGIEVEW